MFLMYSMIPHLPVLCDLAKAQCNDAFWFLMVFSDNLTEVRLYRMASPLPGLLSMWSAPIQSSYICLGQTQKAPGFWVQHSFISTATVFDKAGCKTNSHPKPIPPLSGRYTSQGLDLLVTILGDYYGGQLKMTESCVHGQLLWSQILNERSSVFYNEKKTLPDSDMIDDNVHTQYQAFQLLYKMFTM